MLLFSRILLFILVLSSLGAYGANIFPGVVDCSAGKVDFRIELTPEEYAAIKAEPRAILYVARNDRRLNNGKGGAGRGWQKCKYTLEERTIKLRLPVKDEVQRTLIMFVPPLEKKKGVKMFPLCAGNLGRDPADGNILMVMISFGEKISGGVLLQSGVISGGPMPHRLYKT